MCGSRSKCYGAFVFVEVIEIYAFIWKILKFTDFLKKGIINLAELRIVSEK